VTAVLDIILEVTVYSAILYVAIMLFKKAFRKHLSATLNYAVWTLLVLRLLIPVTIDSGLSLFVISETNAPIVQNQTFDGIQPLDGEQIHTSQESSYPQISSAYKVPVDKSDISAVETSTQAPKWEINWQSAVLLIWAMGVLASGAFMLLIYLRLQRRIKRSGIGLPDDIRELTQSVKRQMGIKADIKVSAHEWLTTPALSASIRPTLLLPANMLQNSEQLMFGIRHELTHYKHKDYLVSLLLAVLRCVYWFNPVVWLTAKQIEADMETACDASVTASMKNDQRGRYIEAVIDLGRNADAQYMLGMGTHTDRKSIEKRIRGVFMTKRTTPAVRTAAALMACLMLIVCFTTACQPTPETPPVINKGDDHLEDMIASSAASSVPTVSIDPEQSKKEQEEALRQALRDRLNAPETYEGSFTNDKGDITVSFDDAQVEVPAVQSIPAAEVKPSGFSQETVDKFAAFFFGDKPLFEEENVRTKEEKEAQIVEVRRSMEEMAVEFGTEGNDEYLKQLEEEYKTAPEERERTPATTEFKKTENGEEVRIAADLGKDETAKLEAYNEEGYSYLRYSNIGKGTYTEEYDKTEQEAPSGISLKQDEAEKIAMQCLGDLGINDMRIDTIGICTWRDLSFAPTDKQCYSFSFARMYRNIPVTNVQASVSLSTDDPDVPDYPESEYTRVYDPERLTVYVDDTGVVEFYWYHPDEEESVLSQNVGLKQFDEIVQKAKDNIFFKNYTAYGSECHIHITSIELGMMRVMKKDAPGEYMMIPVWDFIGNHEHIMDGESHWLPFGDQSYVTINAIDGSHINRDWGY